MGKDLKGKELGVGISQRADGYYVGRFVDKKGRRQQKLFKKLQECRRWMADAQYQDKHSDLGLPSEMTVKMWFDYWLSMKKRIRRVTTVRCYVSTYNSHIGPNIGDKLLVDVKPMHCQEIVANLISKGYCTSTVQSVASRLYDIFEYARKNSIILQNPCEGLYEYCSNGKSSSVREALTREQQKVFLEEIRGRSYEYQWRLILQTGIRVGELCGLKWSDIDLDKRIMHIRRTLSKVASSKSLVVGEPKTKAGVRSIPLTEEAVSILKLQKEKRSGSIVLEGEWEDYVFLSRRGNPILTHAYDESLRVIGKKMGVKGLSMHILRHTFATRCIEGGMKPKTLQVILGHSSYNMTMDRYVHITDDVRLEEMGKIESILNVTQNGT